MTWSTSSHGKAGFCQQYAAALGVMLRVAGIPARVVIGYSHPAPDASGDFEVTSDDAHAWVEAYFTGIGWLPFDPTPLIGADAARAVALPWAPHPTVTATAGGGLAGESPEQAAARDQGPVPKSTPTSAKSFDATETHAIWIALGAFLLVVLVAGLTPALLRVRRRRQRLRLSRELGPEPLWDELADTALDLGLGWSGARSTRQVAAWLGELVETDHARAALVSLGSAVERDRYAARSEATASAGWSGTDWGHATSGVRLDPPSSCWPRSHRGCAGGPGCCRRRCGTRRASEQRRRRDCPRRRVGPDPSGADLTQAGQT